MLIIFLGPEDVAHTINLNLIKMRSLTSSYGLMVGCALSDRKLPGSIPGSTKLLYFEKYTENNRKCHKLTLLSDRNVLYVNICKQ